MIHYHFVTEVRNMKKHKICGVISSVFSVENDTGVVDAFHRLADSMQADLSQREGMPKAYYFAITEFKEVGRDDTTYRDAVQPETQQPQLYEHSDGMMREYPEANDIGQRAMDDLTRAVSTGDPLDINIVAQLLGIKLDALERVAATESNMQAINEIAEKRKNCDHAWVKVLSTESGFFCRKCSSMEGPGEAEPKKQIGNTQAPTLNDGDADEPPARFLSDGLAPGGVEPVTLSDDLTTRSANAPYAKAVDQHYGSDTAAQDGEHWEEWKGDELPPVDIEQQVRVRFRNGEVTSAGRAGDWSWQHGDNYWWDIVAYSLVYA